MDVQEKLRISLLRVLNSNALRLFGCLIYNFDIELIDTDEITWDWKKSGLSKSVVEILENQLTAAVTIIDGTPKMIIFTKFIKEKTIEELIFVMLHEIMHILGGHCIRHGDRNHEIYNLAGDHVINKSLIDDIKSGNLPKTKAPKDLFIVDKLIKKNLTTEEVYDYLYNKAKIGTYCNGTLKTNIPQTSNGINGSNPPTKNEQTNIQIKVLEVEVNNKTLQFPVDATISHEGKNKAKETTESLKSEARAIMSNDNIIGKGNSSGSVANLIKKMIEVEIPWTTLLDRSICSKIVPDPDNRSWRHLQKRMYTHGFTIPGTTEEEKPATLIIAEDQSGSISDKHIKKFASVIMQSIKYFDEVRVIKHDVKIHSDETIDVQSMSMDKVLFETLGRGGTSHKYVFQAIEDSFNDDTSDISLILLLTDFDSDVEREWKKHEWPKEIPVSIILPGHRKIPTYIDPNPILINTKKK